VGWKVLLPLGIGVLMATGIMGLRTEIWDFVHRLVHI
jgi:NADH:ubiquinone oxidoreductase subunit H